MSKRKPLGGTPKAEKLGQLKGLGQAAEALDAPISPDSGDLKHLPIDEVRPDPDNPRSLNLTLEIIRKHPEDIEDATQRKDVEDIQGLAATIRSQGQRQPIEVVRQGGIYRIIFGERRYWATQLAEQSTVKAMVLRAPPDNVPLIQLIENIQHKQLPLWKTILNIRSAIEREKELGQSVKDATDLMTRTGLARASAYRYWNYVDLPNDVDQLLEQGALGTHAELTELMKFSSAKARKQAYQHYIATGQWVAEATTPSTKTTLKTNRGRPRSSYSFGTTKSSKVAETLFSRIDPDGDYSKLDFNDPTAVTKAWKILLQELEKRMNQDG